MEVVYNVHTIERSTSTGVACRDEGSMARSHTIPWRSTFLFVTMHSVARPGRDGDAVIESTFLEMIIISW